MVFDSILIKGTVIVHNSGHGSGVLLGDYSGASGELAL